MILGGLAANSGFSAREIGQLKADEARFWWNAIAAFHERAKAEAS